MFLLSRQMMLTCSQQLLRISKMKMSQSWICLLLIYYGLLPFIEAKESQMKIDFLKDYFKFEHNTRFLLHICFPIGRDIELNFQLNIRFMI